MMFLEKPTVLVVSDFGHVNAGAAQVAIASACELTKRDCEVIFFCGVGPVDPCLAQAGVQVICTQQYDILAHPQRSAAAIQGLWNREAARLMGLLLRSLTRESTVVHFHCWAKALSPSVINIVLSQRFRAVATLHDYFVACPNGGFFNYVSQEICTLKPMSTRCLATNCDSRSYSNKLWRVARQQVQRSIGGMPGGMKHYITVSELSRQIIARFLPPDAEVHPIGNPIDIRDRGPAAPATNQVSICVGRLSAEKGSLLLAEAARRVRTAIRFVGDGYLRERLEQEYPECKVTGWLPRGEVEQEMARARALVLPSLWYENQPLVVLEAAARGIPCLVPDTSAARESVVNGETGLWFRGADCNDLATKLRLLEDSALVARLGAGAYARYWSAPPTLSHHVDQLEQCYAKVLGPVTERISTNEARVPLQSDLVPYLFRSTLNASQKEIMPCDYLSNRNVL
jgi:glycosyltransferase involved in cell wall biosynthesis